MAAATKVRYNICGDRVLIEDFPIETKVGSLFLPNGLTEDLVKGRIVATGPDTKTVKLDDVVVHVRDLGTKLKDGKRTYLNLPENAVIAIDTEYDK